MYVYHVVVLRFPFYDSKQEYEFGRKLQQSGTSTLTASMSCVSHSLLHLRQAGHTGKRENQWVKYNNFQLFLEHQHAPVTFTPRNVFASCLSLHS